MQINHQARIPNDSNKTADANSPETFEMQSRSGLQLSADAMVQRPMNVNSMNSRQLLQLQRTIGNRAVCELFKQNASRSAEKSETPNETLIQQPVNQSASTPPIQRKVYIKNRVFSGFRNKTKTSHGSVGEGERNVSNMLSDFPSRYFNSKDEMKQYAGKSTEKVGYVKKKGTWVRLPNKLLVLGEEHAAVNLSDITTAVGTDKYMHEGFTEYPAEAGSNPELTNDMRGRDAVINQKFKGAEGERSHRAESFYPKILRALSGVSVDEKNYQIQGSTAELAYLVMGIHFASSADKESNLFQTYMLHKEMWDQTATAISSQESSEAAVTQEMRKEASSALFKTFYRDLTAYAEEKIQQEQESAPEKDKASFEDKWHLASKDYSEDGESPMMKAEKARDFSMFQHIKKAKNEGYLLYGLGELHRQRLKELLDKEGIANKNIDTFISEQDTNHPQR
ncbi:hypothetical protein OB236_09335 [Paenibacillus sp. WQ 127069]|uniref:Uncharacterized protein n=1 Tax=Paenibacillus baimaensis TaxID=2982185 RepID=A0ABT2UCG7_9BACL|nr:hypothetical protein [Paenibacillus sp. WQ 127069]MCU6792329.1 hypothetical protein [Paenibacillus sp. WQ 127069]